jgi:glycoside/pentoside/hexuronide:cation symporter, GPH family
VFGVVSLIQKAGLGVAAGILGELLSLIGYTANVAQSPATLEAMAQIMIGLPLLFAVVALLFIMFYPLDRRTHGRIVNILKWRETKQAT